MNKVLSLAVLSTFAFLEARASVQVIYGDDNRQEVFEASAAHQELAKSTAAMVSEDKMSRDAQRPGLVQLDQKTLREWLENPEKSLSQKLFSSSVQKAAAQGASFCSDTRYIEQANPAMCSGFLVGPDLIVTAGHCVEIENFCENYRWVFDFKVDQTSKRAGVDVKEENIYKCKRVISHKLSMILGLDYGLIQLDRKVLGRAPLKIENDLKVKDNQALVVIGNPSGLPTKVAGGANVRNNSHPNFFNANLDTFQGNSGSAVFNASTGVVEGILVRGEEDFVPNYEKMCIEAKKCANNECRGEDISRMTSVPEFGLQKILYAATTSENVVELEKILKLNFWVDIYTQDGQSALMKAASAGKNKSVELLLAKAADVNLQDAVGDTALHLISKNLNESNESTLSTLMSAGAKLELRNDNGETPILAAAKNLNLLAVKKLIALGADKNVTDNNGLGVFELLAKNADEETLKDLSALGVQKTPELERVVLNQ